MSIILNSVVLRHPDVVLCQSVRGLTLGSHAELARLLLPAVPLASAVTLHLEDLRRQLLLGHFVDCSFRVLGLNVADDFVLVCGRHALPRLLRRVVRPRSTGLRLGVTLCVLPLRLLHDGARLTLLDGLHVSCDLGLDASVHLGRTVPDDLLHPSLFHDCAEGVLANVFSLLGRSSLFGDGQVLRYFVWCCHSFLD